MGIVDCHTHVMDPSHFDESFAADLKRAWGEHSWTGVTTDDHWEAVRELDGAIVLALDAPACGFVIPNEYIATYCAQHPEKLIGFASVDPARPDAKARLEHAVTTSACAASSSARSTRTSTRRAWTRCGSSTRPRRWVCRS